MAMSYDDIVKSFSDLSKGLKDVDGAILGLSQRNAAFKANMISLTKEVYTSNSAFAAFGKSTKAIRDSLKDNIKEMRESELMQKKMALAMKAAMFSAGDWVVKMNMTASTLDKLTSGVGKFNDKISGGTLFKLNSVTESITKFNRATFQVSHQLQVMGKELDSAKMERMARAANLSHIQMAELTKDFHEMGNVAGNTIRKLEGITSLARDQFGGSPEVIREMTQRFAELDNMLPGMVDDLDRFSRTGKSSASSMSSLLMTMKGYGASSRQLFTIAQAYSSINKEQKKLLDYETVVQERQKAISDANVAAGKNSETALIAIEKGMTKLVTAVDKIMNKFSIVPAVILSLKAIGITSFMSVAESIKSMTDNMRAFGFETKNATGGIGGMKGKMAGLGVASTVVAGVGIGAYNTYQGASAGGHVAGGTLSDTYSRGIAGDSQMWSGVGTMAGTALGAGVGFALGGPMGAMAGSSLGGLAGGMAGSFFGGGEEGDAKTKKMLESLDRLGDKIEVKEGTRIKSQEDIFNLIKRQSDESKKLLMIDALRRDVGVDIETIERKLGKEISSKYEKNRAIFEQQEKQKATSLALVNNYNKSNEQLEKIRSAYEKIAGHASSMKDSMAQNPFMMGEVARWTQIQATQAKKALEAIEGQREELEKMEKVYFTEDMESNLKNKMGNVGISDDNKAKLVGALKEMMDASGKALDVDATPAQRSADTQKLEAAKKKFDVLVKELNVKEQLKAIDIADASIAEVRLKKIIEAEREERKMNLDVKQRQASIQQMSLDMDSMTVKHSAEEAMLAKIEEREQKRADLLGKTAAGYSAHFQGEKRVYDVIVKRIAAVEKERALVGSEAAKTARDVQKETGLGLDVMAQAYSGNAEALAKINAMQQELIAKDPNDKRIKTLDKFLVLQNKELEIGNKLLDLDSKRIEKALALKEGYLDVINEMTTSSNLVSDLVASSNRGLVSMQQMQMVGAGKDFGGAFSRGFATINPFAGSTGMEGAAQYTQQGFKGPGSMEGTVAAEYMKDIMRNEKAEIKGGGPGTSKAADLERSTAQAGVIPEMNTQSAAIDVAGNVIINGGKSAGGKAGGGLIPGSPSSKDNLTGMIDGKTPVGLATGEFIVNANATKKNIDLLKAINGGYADGGTVDYWKLAKFAGRKALHTSKKIAVRLNTNAHAAADILDANIANRNEVQVLSGAASMAGRGAANMAGKLAGKGVSWFTGLGGSTLQRNISSDQKSNSSFVKDSPGVSNDEQKRNKMYEIQSVLANKMKTVDLQDIDPGVYKIAFKDARERLAKMGINDPSMIENLASFNAVKKTQSIRAVNLENRKKANDIRMKELSDSFNRKGFESGGLISPSSMNSSSMSISGGMRIGTLVLNGRVIGQDVGGGSGSEWKVAAQNAYG
jgi:hypothetical protein